MERVREGVWKQEDEKSAGFLQYLVVLENNDVL